MKVSEDCLCLNAVEEECVSQNDEVDADISIGTEIPDQEPIDIDEIHEEETIPWDPCRKGDHHIPHTLNHDNHGVHRPIILLAL